MEETSLPNIVEHESWGSLAHLTMKFKLELDMHNPKTKKVKKELEFVRHLIADHLKKIDNDEMYPTAAFYVQISKTVQRAELALQNNGVKNKDFLLFLKLILHKLKKEKLVVYKHKERQEELDYMKGLLEGDEYDLIRGPD